MKINEAKKSKRERKYERYDIMKDRHVECSESEARSFAAMLREQIVENDRRREEIRQGVKNDKR